MANGFSGLASQPAAKGPAIDRLCWAVFALVVLATTFVAGRYQALRQAAGQGAAVVQREPQGPWTEPKGAWTAVDFAALEVDEGVAGSQEASAPTTAGQP